MFAGGNLSSWLTQAGQDSCWPGSRKPSLLPSSQNMGVTAQEGTGRGSEQWKEEAWGMIQAPFSKEGLCQILETLPDCPNCHPHKLIVSLAIATSVVGV